MANMGPRQLLALEYALDHESRRKLRHTSQRVAISEIFNVAMHELVAR